MPKIRITLEIPKDNCKGCKKYRYHNELKDYFSCSIFGVRLKETNGMLVRCQDCINAEIKG